MTPGQPGRPEAAPVTPGRACVGRPELPPWNEVEPLLRQVWQARVLTNGGPLHRRLETSLAACFELPSVTLFSSGALALHAALAGIGSARPGGEVVTTPFSFRATTNAIRSAGLVPVFADVEPGGFNLDPQEARRQTGPRTVAILPVHCFGLPCDTDAFEALGRDLGVPVIYDAAHAVGARWRGRSLLGFGDSSATSFHATKLFSTVEGGAVVCRDPADAVALARLRNHGIGLEGRSDDAGCRPDPPGFNGKLGELHAAVGLAQLERLDAVIAARARVDARYRQRLSGVPTLRFPTVPAGAEPNHGYFALRVEAGHPIGRDALVAALGARGITARAYFTPLLSTLPGARGDGPQAPHPHATAAAATTLCLPIHSALSAAEVDDIAAAVAALSLGNARRAATEA